MPAVSRTLALLNPEAGGVDDVEGWRERLASPAGWESAVPGSADELEERVAAASGGPWERIVVAGGDGTVHRAVQALAEAPSPPTLGVVPLGTANDFARSLAMPLEPEEAVGWLASASVRTIDLLELRADDETTTWCVNVAVGGFGGRVGEEVRAEEKRHWGSLAYLRTAVEEMGELPRYRIRIEAPEREALEGEVVDLVIANGGFTGGGLRVAAGARLDDGMLDVLAIPAVGVGRLTRLATAAVSGTLQRRRDVPGLRAERVVVTSEPPLRFRCDGERGPSTPVTVGVRPSALDVVAQMPTLPGGETG